MRGASRTIATLEVCIVLALTHSAWRWIVRETAWGRHETEHRWNFIPGVCLATAALVMIAVGRTRRDRCATAPGTARSPSTEKSSSPASRPEHSSLGPSLLAGALAALLTFTIGGVLVLLGVIGMRPTFNSAGEGVIALLGGILVAALLARLLAGRCGTWLARRSPAWGFGTLAVVIIAPLAKALVESGTIPNAVVVNVAWRLLGAAIGEELFFRGYVQGRLDRAFGTSWRIAGTSFGPGLLIASLLFGAVHLVNPFDFATLEGRLAWGHGLATAGTLAYGVLRARTGSIVAPITLHAIVDLVAVTIRQ